VRSEVLRVRGMTCMHCKANVEQMLLKLDGVEEADVNLERAEVRVIFDDEVVQLEEIKEEIEDIGYDVEE